MKISFPLNRNVGGADGKGLLIVYTLPPSNLVRSSMVTPAVVAFNCNQN